MMRAKYLATREQDRFVSPANWNFLIYSLEPQSFWFSKTSLTLSDDLEIIRYDFRGRNRYKAGLKRRHGLQLAFIDSYSTIQARLQGMCMIDSILMITIGGHDWDGLSSVGVLATELNFSERLANRILDPEAIFTLKNMKKTFGSGRSIVLRPSKAALRLKKLTMKLLRKFDVETGIDFDDVYSSLDLPSIDVTGTAQEEIAFNHDALVEMSQNVMNEITHENVLEFQLSSEKRRNIALKIEELLWRHPNTRNDFADFDLEELCHLFNVSRRTIQLSIQEQFGLGFLAFKKIIRMHQIRDQLLKAKSPMNIGSISLKYGQTHAGRFSNDYKLFFGNYPSDDLPFRKK